MNIRIRKISRVILAAIAVTASSPLAMNSASAQTTYTWANSNVTNTPATLDWFMGGPNTQGTWTGGTPLSSNLNTIQFFSAPPTAVPNTTTVTQGSNVNNGGNAFELGILALSGQAPATPNIDLSMSVTGDALNFSAATGTINLDSVDVGANGRNIFWSVSNAIQFGTASSASTLTLAGNGSSTFNFDGGFSELQVGGGSKLIKSGTSTATLSGAVTVSGGLEVNGGLLKLTNASNAITGGITLNGGALGDNTGTISTATLNNNNITVNGAASLGLAGGATTNGGILLNSGANLTLATNNNSATINGAVTGVGSISINRLGGGSHTQNLNSTANTFTGTVSFTATSTATLNVNSFVDSTSAGAGNIRFVGSAGGNAHTFALGSGAIAPLTLNNRRFEIVSGSSAAYTIANNSSQAFIINSDLLVGATGSQTLILGGTGAGLNSFNGKIENGTLTSLGLTLSGSATWVLGNAANTYTGTTRIGLITTAAQRPTAIINTLKNYGVASSLGAPTSGDIIFQRHTGGNLIYVGSGDTSNRTIRHEPDVNNRNNNSRIYNNGTGALIFNGATFNTPFVESGNGGRTTVLNLGGTYTGSANEIRGVIADNDLSSLIGITKDVDTSTWQLSGANTYSGINTISGGMLRGTQTSGTPFGTGAVTINAGTLSIAPSGSGSAVSLTGGTRASGTLFTYNAGAALSLNKGTQDSLTYTFGGTGNTTARGTNGTLILSTSDIANFGAAGSKTERFIMNGNAPSQVSTLVSGVVIQDRNNSNAGDFSTYDGTDGFTRAIYTATDFSGSTNTSRLDIGSASTSGATAVYAMRVSGTVTNTGNTLTLGNGTNPAALILNGGSISGGTLASAAAGAEFLIYTSGASSISSAITTSTSGMSVFGPGSLTLSSSNSFTGGLRVNNSTLIVSNDNQLGGANNAITLRGGTLQTSGDSLAIGVGARAITLASGQDQTGGTFNVTSGNTTFQNNSTGARIISGSGSLTKTGAGTLELNGNTSNTYTGGTFVSGGTLRLGAGSMLADTGAVTVSGGTFDIQTFTDTVGAVRLVSGSIAGSTGVLAGTSYAMESGVASAILAGTNAALTKTTPGTVTLSGTNTYTGGTSVAGGTLLVNNASGSGTGSGNVAVSAGATLGGSGVISGLVSIDAGGFLAPGNSPGQLTVGGLTLNGTSTTTMELGGTTLGTLYDNIMITAADSLTYGGNLTVINFAPYDMNAASFTYDLFSFNGSTSGNFSNVLVNSVSLSRSGDTWTGSSGPVDYSFSQSTGNLVISIVPEPATIALLASGVAIAGYLRSRRRRG